jgi:hypothetical protein
MLALAGLACAPAEPTAASPEVVVAPPMAPKTSAPAAIPPATDGCLVVADPYQLDIPAENMRRAIERRDEEVAARREKDPCVPDVHTPECRYRLARDQFETFRYDLAAPLFRALALEGASNLGQYAALHGIESLSLLATRTRPRRPACVDRLAEDAEAYLEVYCRPVRPDHEDSCELLARAAHDARRTLVERLVERADASPPSEQAVLFGRAGDGFRALFDAACPIGMPRDRRQSHGCVDLIHNAHRAYRAAGRDAEAETARRILLDPRHEMDETEPAKKLASEPRTR